MPRAYTTRLFSSPKLKPAQTYKVYTGGTSSATFTTSTVVAGAGGSTGR